MYSTHNEGKSAVAERFIGTLKNISGENVCQLYNTLHCQLDMKGTSFFVFFLSGYRNWRFTGQQGKGGDHRLFRCTTSTRSQTLRHLFETLHVRWLSRIFNRSACVYQTATRWDLPPYRITIWLIDWLIDDANWLTKCAIFIYVEIFLIVCSVFIMQ